jgi:GNAT superfamily N-acetyltransferase
MEIAYLSTEDRVAWESLARGYKAFYRTEVSAPEYAAAWEKLLARDGVLGLGARVDGELVGLAHFLFHASTWTPTVCYLQDLFTAPSARGKGVARALIETVADVARERGATRYYWLTQEGNEVARALYDKVAAYHGFIRYDYPLAARAG